MGLDMYLHARKYLSSLNSKDQELIEKIAELTENTRYGMQLTGLEYQVMYWRKANAIHNWFVKNVQNGVDDCRAYEVTLEHLDDLLRTLEKIGGSKELAAELLPPCEGFFFGSSELTEGYWADLELTKQELRSFLEDLGEDIGWNWTVTYRSSW
jgi:hypothetical protein